MSPRMLRYLLPVMLLGLPAASLADEAPTPARQAELETLLYQDCGSCHGMTLRGGLGPALTRERMARYDRDALAGLILHGVPGTAMPGWAPLLSGDDARWLADHLQQAAPSPADPDPKELP